MDLESGAPLQYVNIGVIGTPIGTISQGDGSYFLEVSKASDKDSLRNALRHISGSGFLTEWERIIFTQRIFK